MADDGGYRWRVFSSRLQLRLHEQVNIGIPLSTLYILFFFPCCFVSPSPLVLFSAMFSHFARTLNFYIIYASLFSGRVVCGDFGENFLSGMRRSTNLNQCEQFVVVRGYEGVGMFT